MWRETVGTTPVSRGWLCCVGGGDEETAKCGIEQRKREGGGIYGGGALVPGEYTTRDQRVFGPGSWLHQGPKGVLAGWQKCPAAAHF